MSIRMCENKIIDVGELNIRGCGRQNNRVVLYIWVNEMWVRNRRLQITNKQ